MMAADIKRVLFMLTYSAVVVTYSSAQHTVKNVTLTETLFSSPGYIDGLNYADNTMRDYRFHTFYHNHTLLLTVKEFVLEYPDKNNDCLYDKVTIYDGYNDTSPVLRVLCGTIAAGTTYRTSGDTVYIVFYSDSATTFKGFQISVVSYGPTTTTSTTTTSTTSTTSSITTFNNHEPTSSMTPKASTSQPTISQATLTSAPTVTKFTSSATPAVTSVMHLSTKTTTAATSSLSLTKTKSSPSTTLTRMSLTHSSLPSVMPSVRTLVPKAFDGMRKIKSLMFRTRDFVFYEFELSPVFNDKT